MNKVKKFYLVISALFILNALIILGFAAGSYAFLLNQNTDLLEKNYYAKMLDEKYAILSALKIKYEKVQNSTELLSKTLPEDKSASSLMSDLSTLSQKNGLKFTYLKSDVTNSKKKNTDPSLLQTQNGKYGQEMPIIIEVSGSYNNFVSFVKSLESYQRLLNIKSIEIKKESDGAVQDTIIATLKITVYLKK
ncbi:MAG: type 4a pilus biogenesis protein PilO [Patescibacteria group bacterium]|nr:type 4a pilus biogenesis protein PilO [Patescibacteria group bacterium]